MAMAHGHEHGFSLLEVLVATTVITVAVAALAQLFALATHAVAGARATTYAAVLAQQKMEQLRGLTWGFDALGLPVTDTTTDVSAVPETGGGRGLSLSPAHSLGTNSEGYCDFVDAFGRPLGGGTAPPAGTAYIRRWSIEALPADPDNTIVLQVLVTRAGSHGADTRRPRPARPTKRGSSASRPEGRVVVRRDGFSALKRSSPPPAAPRHGERLQHDAPVAWSVAAQPEVTDMQQRLRVAADTLSRDLMMAGAGAYRGLHAGPLVYSFPPVLPFRRGVTKNDPPGTFAADRITIISVPSTSAQTTLGASLSGPAASFAPAVESTAHAIRAPAGGGALRVRRKADRPRLRRQRQLQPLHDRVGRGRDRDAHRETAGRRRRPDLCRGQQDRRGVRPRVLSQGRHVSTDAVRRDRQ
jgi:prepilin-type N-terminal cleavage/methylation domain-containing protein